MEELAEDYCISIPATGGKEGKTVDNKFLAGIIEARTEEILDYVCDQIEKSGFGSCMDEIVITGGGSQLQHLIEKLKLRTGLSVRVGIPNQKIAFDMDESHLRVENAQLLGLLIHAEKPCVKEKTVSTDVTVTENKNVKNRQTNKSGKGFIGFFTNLTEKMFSEDSQFTEETK